MEDTSVKHEDIPLRVLLVEDSQQDADLVLMHLQRAGFIPAWHRVENESEMRSELEGVDWDLILCDFTMPHFSGEHALSIANELVPETPLIVVSGDVGEEKAAALMREGARDYVMKSNLSRLVPTVRRELEEARLRHESRELNNILDNVNGILLPLTGKEFFEALVKVIAESVDMKTVEICSISPSEDVAKVIARCDDGKLYEGGEHPLNDPIYKKIIDEGMVCIESKSSSQFSDNEFPDNQSSKSLVGYALNSAAGDVIGMLLVFDDKPVTTSHTVNSIIKLCSVRAAAEIERITNEQRLQESERQMRNILGNMQDTFFRIDTSNIVTWVTPSVEELIGYKPDDVVGQPYRDYFTSNISDMDLVALLNKNKGKVSGLELSLRHRDGSVVWVSINAQYYNDYNENTIAGIEGLARNITQQRMAEIALRQSEELFSKAFHASPAMIALSHLHENYEFGGFIDVNEAFLERCGYTREEMIGRSISEINFFVDDADLQGLVSALRENGYGRDIELPFQTRSGKTRYALGSIELIDIGGDVCALSVFQDMTERLNAQNELEQHREHLEELVSQRTRELSEAVNHLEIENKERRKIEQALVEATTRAQAASKAKSEFLANMSHELRTPLNSIIGFSELIMLEPDDEINPENREKLTYILDSAWHLLSLINDILDLSKIEAGKMELDIDEVSTDRLVQSSASLFRQETDKQGINLVIKNMAEGEAFFADERKLKQVLFNLVSNATKFTPRDGSVTVAVSVASQQDFELFCGCPHKAGIEHDSFLDISVTDTGIGISKEDCAELFAPFKQVDSSVTREYEGTGLGLHLCRQMVELHGGCINVESEPGVGSCFRFMIPCAPCHRGISGNA